MNCRQCEGMSLWGTLMVRATKLVVLNDGDHVYCCPGHANLLLDDPRFVCVEGIP